jgi:hypothetical protein
MVAQLPIEDISQTGLHGYLQHPLTSINIHDSKKGGSARVRRAGGRYQKVQIVHFEGLEIPSSLG